MAILGNQQASAGAYGTNGFGAAGRKFVTQHTLATGGTLTELHGWFGQTAGNPQITLCVYADSSGSPGALVAYTSPLNLAAGSSDVELSQTGLSFTIAAGTYWIGWVDTVGAKYYYDATGTMKGTLGGAAGNPPSDPFGTIDFGPTARDLGVWAVVGAPAPVTKTGVGKAGTVGAGAKVAVIAPITSTKAGRGVAGLAAFGVVIAPMEHPHGIFSVAFDAPTMAANPHWTRIDTLSGCRVREWTIDRGRPNEFSKTDVGTATVRLVDRAGLFDPTNTTSPFYGKVLPGKQATIALLNPVTDVWWTLFRGFIESWRYRLDPTEQYMELELQLVDGFAILARAELRVGIDGALPPYTGTELEDMAAGNILYAGTLDSVNDRIMEVTSDAGWPSDLTDYFSGNVQVGRKSYPPGTSALDAVWDAVDAEIPNVANLWVSKEGILTFRGRQARFRPEVADYGINRRTVGDPSAFTLDEDVVPVSELEWSSGFDNMVNACSATPEGIGIGMAWRPIDPEVDDIAGQYITDPASIALYGIRSLTFDNLQTVKGNALGTDALEETKLFAVYYASNYSTPSPRISRMVFKSRRPTDPNGEALWNHLCKCEISDLLTLQTEHPGGGGFDTEFFVEGIHYTGRPGSPDLPIVELGLDVSPRAHYTTNPWEDDTDP